MTRFHFQRPDGPPSNNVQNPSSVLNSFVPPQGFSGEGGGVPTLVASFDASGTLDGATGVKFDDVGDNLYISSSLFALIFQFEVPTAFSMNPNPIFNSQTKNVIAQDSSPTGLAWSGGINAGNKLFMIGNQNDIVFQYPVSTNFDVTTAGSPETNTILTGLGFATGLSFAVNGNKLYVSGSSGNLLEYSLSTAFDIQSGVTGPVAATVTFPDPDIRGVELSTNGDKLFVVGRTAPAKVYQYALGTNFDITTLSTNPTAEFDLTSQTQQPFGLTFSPDGTQMFIVDRQFDIIFEYILPSSFQL